jgi:hypothetical protein
MKPTKIHTMRGAAGARLVTNAGPGRSKIRAHDPDLCGCLNCRLAAKVDREIARQLAGRVEPAADPLTAGAGLLSQQPAKRDDKPLKAQGLLAAHSRRAAGPMLPAGVLRTAS